MSYLKNKKDGNHREAVQYLTKHGVEVTEFKTPLDLLCWRNGTTCWCEIKMPGSQAKFTRKQLEYMAGTRHNVVIATSPEEALGSMREKRWLSQRSKDGLAGMLLFSDKSKLVFTPAEVAIAIGRK